MEPLGLSVRASIHNNCGVVMKGPPIQPSRSGGMQRAKTWDCTFQTPALAARFRLDIPSPGCSESAQPVWFHYWNNPS
jgi:hypothetical protein